MKFGGIDIDLNLESIARERLPVVTGLADVETGSEDEQKVGALDRKVAGAIADGALASTEERIVGGDDVVGPRGGDGNAKAMDQGRRIRLRRERRERRCRRGLRDAWRRECGREFRGRG